MTQDYYGTKRVTAWRQDKPGSDGDVDTTSEGYAVKYADGYISWSPKDKFQEAYRPITAMSFGHAIVALVAGQKVARKAWNGKAMFVWLEKGSVDFEETDLPQFYPDALTVNGVPIELFEYGPIGSTTRMPHLCMRTSYGATITGWSASQTDMLAEDWMIVD